MKYTHIIFDMDGTLVNSLAYTIPGCKVASAELGMPVPTDEAIAEGIGYASEEFYPRLFPHTPQEMLDQYGTIVHAREQAGIRALGEATLFPGIKEMLMALKSGGATLHIASTGEMEYVQLALGSAGIAGLFSGISAGEPRKEEMAKRIRAGVPDGSWAFVGDRFKDADAARAAEMPSVFAGWGFSPAEESALFSYIANTTNELLGILGYGEMK
jgi:phosphoglycolate phosphatase